jgi:membrane protein implicated in regulation of membrane protease activity
MIAWWNSLETAQQIFALIAIPTSLIMLIQTVLLLIGFGGETDADGDDVFEANNGESDGLALFSVRGIVSMLTVFGWAGVAFWELMKPFPAVLLAAALGLLTLFGMAYLMRAVSRLQSSGNIDVENAVGKVAKVYIPIPPAGKGTGKVTITLQEKYSELSAITTSEQKIATGSLVRVVAVDGTGTLLVEPLIADKKEAESEE